MLSHDKYRRVTKVSIIPLSERDVSAYKDESIERLNKLRACGLCTCVIVIQWMRVDKGQCPCQFMIVRDRFVVSF